MQLSYRMLFILTMMLFGLLFLGFYSATYYFQSKADVSSISTINLQEKAKERLDVINFFNNRFPISLNSIEQNPNFQAFIKNRSDTSSVENLFLSVQKSTACTAQMSFLDMQGKELIRTDSVHIAPLIKPTDHRIVPKEELQIKTNRSYFQQFKHLKEGEIGVSDIELNMEFGEITEPKQPVVRYAKLIYQNGEPQGILVFNICLTKFFNQFIDSTFYNVYIIDQMGRFILYKDPKKSLTGPDFANFSVHDAFGIEKGNRILTQETFLDALLYSTPVKGFSEQQNLKLILELKFNDLSNEAKQNANLMLILIIITILVMLPVAIYLSGFPERLMQKLDFQAHRDELTLLPNKTSLFEDLESAPNRVLILLRIDNLREINNVYGYLLANELLTELGKKLENMAKSMNFQAYKLPSNLFAISLVNNDRVLLEAFMSLIHNQIEHDNFSIMDNHEFNLSITLGASSPDQSSSMDEMLMDAEKAMHLAVDKKIEFSILDHKVDLKAQYEENIRVLELIRYALLNNQVMTYFQPIYNNKTQQVDKFEVLMRLIDEKGIIYPPNTFLEIAKASKYYHRLTRAMIEQATTTFENSPYEFSINISFQDIMHEGFLEFLMGIMGNYKDCQRMVIEIVESEGLGDYEEVSDFIHQIKQTGCKIAIDDFGSGYSNFEHLLRLRADIDYIKIDGSLIRNLVGNEINQSIVKNIKSFCDDLGILTIAEYVADEAIQKIVNDMGIDYSQGYYFGQPHNEVLNPSIK